MTIYSVLRILINLNANEPPLIQFMNIITNIIYEIEQPIILVHLKSFSISDHLPYVYEALIIQKYNLELIYKIILPIHNKISSEEYKERAIIIITQLNGYLVQHSNKNTDESYKEFLRSILLKNILRLVSEP